MKGGSVRSLLFVYAVARANAAYLFVGNYEVKVALPGAHALAKAAQPNGFAHGKIGRQGYLDRFKLARKGLAYLQANAFAWRKVCRGQGEALLLVNLSAQPALDHAGNALAVVFVPLWRTPGKVALVQFYVPLFGGRLCLGLLGRGFFWPGRGRFCLMLAVQLAVNIFKNTAGKGVCKQVAQNIVLGVAGLCTLLTSACAVCLCLALFLPVGPASPG